MPCSIKDKCRWYPLGLCSTCEEDENYEFNQINLDDFVENWVEWGKKEDK